MMSPLPATLTTIAYTLLALALLAGCATETTPAAQPSTQIPQWTVQESGTTASLRGVSAVDDQVAWASGSDGTFLRTTDGGVTWETNIVPDASELDFRDVHAVDATTAYLLSAGTPATVYKTTDGGATWTRQYHNEAPEAFFDAMDFWDADHGLAFSDPVEGSFLVITTADGGTTWTPVPTDDLPLPLEGEAGFAGSGTCLVVEGAGNAWIGTGGAAARILRTTDRGQTWTAHETPLLSGEASTGIFALAFSDARHGVIVGGDYLKPDQTTGNAAYTTDGGVTWVPIETAPPAGYRSDVAYVPGTDPGTFIAVGVSGSDYSTDGGRKWARIDTVGYHTVSIAPSGAGWAAGADGRIARLTSGSLTTQ